MDNSNTEYSSEDGSKHDSKRINASDVGQENSSLKNLSLDDLKKSYYGNKITKNTSTAPKFNTASDLTSTAKYITEEAKKKIGQNKSENIDEEDLFRLVKDIEDYEDEELSDRERHAVIAALSASLEHYDILSHLIEKPDVNDIIIQSYKDISVQIGRRNVQTDLAFPSHQAYKSFVENLLKRVGKACTLATPVVDAAIDPHIRACVTHESFSPPGAGPMLTLRVVRHPHVSIETLVSHELAPQKILDYLAVMIKTGEATMLISGEVGTGKTTLIKALTTKIREEDAILIIEDTNEIVLKRPFTRTLLTREANTEGAGRISPAMAIRTGMRMAMNRIILGEMRDSEAAEAFVDVCSSGHSGVSTVHARSARDALSRLELFLLRAQPGVGTETVRKEISNAISIVVHLGLDRVAGKRRILEVIEVGESSDGSIQISPIFKYKNGAWYRGAGLSKYDLDKLGLNIGESGDQLAFN